MSVQGIDETQDRIDPPLLLRLRQQGPLLWTNPDLEAEPHPSALVERELAAAVDRLERARPLLRQLFPQLASRAEPIRSDLLPAAALPVALGLPREWGSLLVKCDHRLPIAGSIKARGGFHEVMAFAERVAVKGGVLPAGGDLTRLASPDARALLSTYSIVVGSTGNLGLSIGMISSALGFNAIVHMSSDAKQWKKQLLRDNGVRVVEHSGDYANAVALGRAEALADPLAHFVDDEHSIELFVGYAAASYELDSQLRDLGIRVDRDHPLFVYLPCGVGGAPGGITYGLKKLFGPDVHCFFVEPTASPCMLVQLAAKGDAPISVYDIGLTNRTEADGLAVGQASMLVAPLMRSRLSGALTVTDEALFGLLAKANETEGLEIEPSAAAGFAGPLALLQSPKGQDYIRTHDLAGCMRAATHVAWTTGGLLVPGPEQRAFLERGRAVESDLCFG